MVRDHTKRKTVHKKKKKKNRTPKLNEVNGLQSQISGPKEWAHWTVSEGP